MWITFTFSITAPKEPREEVIEKDKEYEFQVGVKGKPGEQRKKTEEIQSEEEIPEEPQPVIETAVEAPTEYTGKIFLYLRCSFADITLLLIRILFYV